jgi:hypothetical protein
MGDHGSAEISPCGRYRYVLRRRWSPGVREAVFLMLNPSTADANRDDPTVRKCAGFAKNWGMDCLTIVNLFAHRATDPRELRRADGDIVGPDNDTWIARSTASLSALIIFAWGGHGDRFPERTAEVDRLVGRAVRCLGTTDSGQPRHPLMLPYATVPEPWAARRALGEG